jgi:hypothetical protein
MSDSKSVENSIANILYEKDPIGIGSRLGFPNNKDEYDAEAKEIASALSECWNREAVNELVAQVFEKWFGKDVIDLGTTRDTIRRASEEIYSLKLDN